MRLLCILLLHHILPLITSLEAIKIHVYFVRRLSGALWHFTADFDKEKSQLFECRTSPSISIALSGNQIIINHQSGRMPSPHRHHYTILSLAGMCAYVQRSDDNNRHELLWVPSEHMTRYRFCHSAYHYSNAIHNMHTDTHTVYATIYCTHLLACLTLLFVN